jgi:hypothetical protein
MKTLKPCGTRAAYRRGCRCEDCKVAYAKLNRERSQARRDRIPIPEAVVGRCLVWDSEVFRATKRGPTPRYCSEKCNHKDWVDRNKDKVLASSIKRLEKVHSTPGMQEAKRKYSRDRLKKDPTYFSRLFWKRKKVWIDYLGGKCPCGENRLPCLDFDHIDPSTKFKGICTMLRYPGTYSEDEIEMEVKKCQVLCANCHRIKTSTQWDNLKHLFEA